MSRTTSAANGGGIGAELRELAARSWLAASTRPGPSGWPA